MSLEEIRRLYFKIKDEVFLGNNYGFDTPTLERLLQDTFPAHVTMNCPTNHSTKSVKQTEVYTDITHMHEQSLLDGTIKPT